ncbi:hypothetical protein F441_22231 [Phytophthora nicotianae CJ01A1]|uniref:CCHC-type domain-containing protein n=1 Tax=Phytophthora nicotianae CJ01A1 TaxID=1317063 RepID=W2VRR5_PHYNI|nr:hypothetical protein F441_22231 [Phytophthora nicotianae CJ01A1]
MYEGKYGEDIELWMFATEQYYASRRELMEADSSGFVTIISSNLGQSVLNWYRAFIAECERANKNPTWSLFKQRLRTRFRPKNPSTIFARGCFVSNRTRLSTSMSLSFKTYCRRQNWRSVSWRNVSFSRTDYVKKKETAKKIKEESPSTLQEAIEIVLNFEFAHYSVIPPRAPSKPSEGAADSVHRPPKSKQQNNKRYEKMKGANYDWKKKATCRNCGKVGHISPDCTQPKRTEANRYMQGAVYAILEAEARVFQTEDQERPVTIFIDNSSSLNGVTEE